MNTHQDRRPRRPLEIKFDPEADAAYLPFTDIGPGEAVRQVVVQGVPAEADIVLDFSADGRLLGIEVIGALAVFGAKVLGLPDKQVRTPRNTGDPMVEFHGLQAWPTGSEVIECCTGDLLIDLHNDCTLTGIEILCRPRTDLTFHFLHRDVRAIEVTFSGVLDLDFRQDEQDARPGYEGRWDPAEVSTFYGVEYVDGDDGMGTFHVATITGDLTFRADRVSLTGVA